MDHRVWEHCQQVSISYYLLQELPHMQKAIWLEVMPFLGWSTFNDFVVWRPSHFCLTCGNFRGPFYSQSPKHINWGSEIDIYCSLAAASDTYCFLLLPSTRFDQEHGLLNILYPKSHLRTYFKENPACKNVWFIYIITWVNLWKCGFWSLMWHFKMFYEKKELQ